MKSRQRRVELSRRIAKTTRALSGEVKPPARLAGVVPQDAPEAAYVTSSSSGYRATKDDLNELRKLRP